MRFAATLSCLALGLLATAASGAAPANAVASSAAIQDPAAADRGFDHGHSLWGTVLEERWHPGGLVDYAGLVQDRGSLNRYLRSLEVVAWEDFRQWSRRQREAFWINAYNAYAIQLILDHYPVDSIKDIGSLFSSVFSKEFIPLQHLSPRHDDLLSLGDVEHEVLFPSSRTPLFHFGIVCASTSCPELRSEPYVASRLDEQLAGQARRFFADPTRNAQAFDGRTLYLSKIFDWAEDEFETYPGGIPALLKEYGPPGVADDERLARPRIKYLKYDWSLNEWKPRS